MASERTTQAAEKYTQYRPKYPPELFSLIINFVKDKFGESKKYPLAVDVGCGPGLMSTACLAPYFDKVLGVDISESQIEQATLNNKQSNIEYRLSAAENLPVEEKSVILIQAATALHWFDLEKFYRECDRVLVPGGVVAAFCYDVLLLVVNHLQSDKINKVVKEITERLNSEENPAYKAETHQLSFNRYTHPGIQIPYLESVRIDDFYFSVTSTIRNFIHFYETTSLAKDFLKQPKIKGWWESCTERIMEAYGTENIDDPLTYRLNVFLLLGQKPLT